MEEFNQNINKLTVLILAAGYGRRMGPFSRMINKCLIPYKNKPLISHIFDKFPIETKFIIACGSMSQQVKDYVSNVHQEKDIIFVDIPKFDEATTGPATTIRYCEEYINGEFIWISCDTLFDFDYEQFSNENWIGVYPVDSSMSADYCWVERNGNDIVGVQNKMQCSHAVSAFIGLMHSKDNTFLKNLKEKNANEAYEGFLPNLNLKAYDVATWKDFGTFDKWKQINKESPEISFPKPDELFYSDNNKIIKFTTDSNLAKLKYHRAQLNLSCMPSNVSYAGNFLFYDKEAGNTFYNYLTLERFEKFLNWAEINLWKNSSDVNNGFDLADAFYRTKTLDRLSKFRIKYNNWVEPLYVNETNVKTIEEYISQIDFDWLASSTVWKFIHGDMQFDNIIYNEMKDTFVCIDWRAEFAGNLYGDMYYDLAKLLGGLYLNYKDIKECRFNYTETDAGVVIDIPTINNLYHYVMILKMWVRKNELDWDKVKTLVPIIYLNMAPLHDPPFDKFLISLAQLMFSKL